jgi:hypothetical protein
MKLEGLLRISSKTLRHKRPKVRMDKPTTSASDKAKRFKRRLSNMAGSSQCHSVTDYVNLPAVHERFPHVSAISAISQGGAGDDDRRPAATGSGTISVAPQAQLASPAPARAPISRRNFSSGALYALPIAMLMGSFFNDSAVISVVNRCRSLSSRIWSNSSALFVILKDISCD